MVALARVKHQPFVDADVGDAGIKGEPAEERVVGEGGGARVSFASIAASVEEVSGAEGGFEVLREKEEGFGWKGL